MVSVGDTVTFEATLGRAEGLPANVERGEAWSGRDTLIAWIDPTGVAEGVSPGDVNSGVRRSGPSVQGATEPQVRADQDINAAPDLTRRGPLGGITEIIWWLASV